MKITQYIITNKEEIKQAYELGFDSIPEPQYKQGFGAIDPTEVRSYVEDIQNNILDLVFKDGDTLKIVSTDDIKEVLDLHFESKIRAEIIDNAVADGKNESTILKRLKAGWDKYFLREYSDEKK